MVLEKLRADGGGASLDEGVSIQQSFARVFSQFAALCRMHIRKIGLTALLNFDAQYGLEKRPQESTLIMERTQLAELLAKAEKAEPSELSDQEIVALLGSQTRKTAECLRTQPFAARPR